MLAFQEDSEVNTRNSQDSAPVQVESDNELNVDISDALSERDKVKFTVHTRTTLEEMGGAGSEYSVVREHEEFLWLHTAIEEHPAYAGYIIPPPPPRPDFDASREKLQKLGEGEGTMTKDEFAKMKAELEAEYLATFKKTVAMHEMFLQRLASHMIFKNDANFRVFLTYKDDLSVRGRNKKEIFHKFFSKLNQSADEFMSPSSERNDVFDPQKHFLVSYQSHVENAFHKADKMTQAHKRLADNYIRISTHFLELSKMEAPLRKFVPRFADGLERARRCEGRACSDIDLKLTDILKYYFNETRAARDLMQRRVRCLADYETANKMVEKARFRDREVRAAEEAQREACTRYKDISGTMERELADFRIRRIANFRKSLIELAELQLKHNKSAAQVLRNCLLALKSEMIQEEL
ncbi:sorting nexin-32-like [Varroa jacobsoni]|uniref:Sorting nexin n=1 Tax=Varroa destructor TaxID=109461 RepID=A0A7M7KJH0_VARDE|nr:sorting nexin-32-like [Varroa destructor]XP_022667692.1 sorting nexin-32-like [Varroa destructor]XP_022667693.1 sorting nexin-32-like [Varroa destructor]XP_022667695.1 sorting nexin-32-like [Varroa destructor]XP_022667696.1 sorting nexin-32-like [Varroa destructor]XP_022667697.1 sorting nexin-32-like [Varroa destructor]XP_022667698.1 sorting nexin-32-like [Varroa destructor]XP_022667699.1 sorting nexin-32-like [Varroa destructor]XP_022667700.1 sorting nexin-32-like [Varroa destructor]XP